ncbi:MAG TPA: alpha-hydroxy-acid oxidizing enzyme, partial [Actinomycetota bacterium]|nr:alpha-hydroxy-acid oxidizing enzyme [Actinomycetota bacterium]
MRTGAGAGPSTRRRDGAVRRLPRWRELRELLRPASLATALGPRIERAHTIGDLRSIAARRSPRAVFDYVDGGAGDELSIARS